MEAKFSSVFFIFFLGFTLTQAHKAAYVGVNVDTGLNSDVVKSYSVEKSGGYQGSVGVDVAVPAPHSLFVEKTIQPAIVEKQVDVKVPAEPQNVYVKKVYSRRHHPRREFTYVQNSDVPPPPRTGLLTKLITVRTAGTAVVPEESVPVQTGTVTGTVHKSGSLFNDIFNIPISTLKAVNQLVNNIAGGTSVQVTKSVSAAKTTDVQTHHPINHDH